MKVIDLLNKIAKGEEVPKEIKYKNENLYFDYETTNYFNDEDMHSLFCGTQFVLNDEVEIIEEEKDIEELPPYVTNADLLKEITMNRNKINEIVRKLKDKE